MLYNLDEIHESLYDMLNQRYKITKSGKMYCRIALGAITKICFVEKGFKCIVIAAKKDCYSDTVPVSLFIFLFFYFFLHKFITKTKTKSNTKTATDCIFKSF